MKLPRIKAGGKILLGSLQLLITLQIMVFFFYRLFKYGDFDPCVLTCAVVLCFSGTTWINRGRRALPKKRGNRPKQPKPARPKHPPGKQRPDRERRKRRGRPRTAASSQD